MPNEQAHFLAPIDSSSHGRSKTHDFNQSDFGTFELPPNYDDEYWMRGLGQTKGVAGVFDAVNNMVMPGLDANDKQAPKVGNYSQVVCVVNPNVTPYSGLFVGTCGVNWAGNSQICSTGGGTAVNAAAGIIANLNPNTHQVNGIEPAQEAYAYPLPLKLTSFGTKSGLAEDSALVPGTASTTLGFSNYEGFSSIGLHGQARGGDRFTNIFNGYSCMYWAYPYRQFRPVLQNSGTTVNRDPLLNLAGIQEMTRYMTAPNQPFILEQGWGYFKVQCFLPPPINVGQDVQNPTWRQMGPSKWMYMVANPGAIATNVPQVLSGSISAAPSSYALLSNSSI